MRRLSLVLIILVLEFVVLEAGLRWHGGSDVSPAFRALFESDDRIGHRLRPGGRARYTTVEFSTDLRINAQGVRDDRPIGPKPPGERRVVVLGDSLTMAVQVPSDVTFCGQLERRLNDQAPAGTTWRVINAGVQGYGPMQEWLFFEHVAAAFEPDVVVVVAFSGNDALEAFDTRDWLESGRALPGPDPVLGTARRLVRSSVVLQLARLRYDQLRARLETDAPERPLAAYLADPPPEVAAGGEAAREAYRRIRDRAASRGARTAIVLMPARFETDDGDFGRLASGVSARGGTLVRHAAGARLGAALAPLGLPVLDLLPRLQSESQRVGLFFQRNVHLTPRGHGVVASAIAGFLDSLGWVAPAGGAAPAR